MVATNQLHLAAACMLVSICYSSTYHSTYITGCIFHFKCPDASHQPLLSVAYSLWCVCSTLLSALLLCAERVNQCPRCIALQPALEHIDLSVHLACRDASVHAALRESVRPCCCCGLCKQCTAQLGQLRQRAALLLGDCHSVVGPCWG